MRVHGIDLSAAMVARLQAKPDAELVDVTVGDFAATTVEGTFTGDVGPSELDLMAQLAGMTLRGRWGDWNREPFTAASIKHVSVWAKTR